MKSNFVFVFLFLFSFAQAQKSKKDDKLMVTSLQQHIQFLANDKLEGRSTGSVGEKLAMAYISDQFKKAGLQPKGVDEYYQPFEVNEGKQINKSTAFIVNGKELQLNKDFFPLVYSPNIKMEVMPSMALLEPNMPWFLDIKELLEKNAQNPHFDVNAAVKEKAIEFEKKGATVLFIYNTSAIKDGLAFNGKDRSALLHIPVIYLTQDAIKNYFNDESATLDIRLSVDIGEKKRTGNNVIGYIDNGAPTIVVLGAHYDHLGFGEDGNTLLHNAAPQVYNGADDNASGIAALIELAKMLKSSKLKANNYLFIAFSGEELGLFGSKYFTENPTIDLNSINYMVNMDMMGRLNEQTNTITVGGYGTSPFWATTFAATGKNKLYTGPINYRFDTSGVGPSDHTSFYRKNIPVLFYFTGLHSDYHKPTDDFDKINYGGEAQIIKHIYSVIESADKQKAKLAFTKTKEMQTSTGASFSVTLGIMPDYTFAGIGVRVDGVSEGKVAEKAGLKTGDIITKIGAYNVATLEEYMQALSKFKKGDQTTVNYKRANEMMTAAIEF